MSNNKVYVFPNNTNQSLSSIQMINEYKNKYNFYNKYKFFDPISKSHMKFNNTINVTKNNKHILSVPNNENTETQAINKINELYKKCLINKSKRETQINKIYSFRGMNKYNIYLETENEKINDIIPEPFPIKINQTNKINYNTIIQNIFHNKVSLKLNNKHINNKTKKKVILNNIDIEDDNSKKSYINYNKVGIKKHSKKNLFKQNNKKKYNYSYTNINNFIKNTKNNNEELIYVLKNLDLDNLINVFNNHYINFKDLYKLNKQDLLEMNIPIGPRNRIINFINEYKNYGKDYDLNELKKFFKNKTKKETFINNDIIKTNNILNISYSEKNISNKKDSQCNNKNKGSNNNYSNYKNISIFNDYYENKDLKKINNTDINLYKNKNILSRYNSITNNFNDNILKNKNEEKKETISIKNIKNISNYTTLNNKKIIRKAIKRISPIVKNKENKPKNKLKKSLFKSFSLNNQKKYNTLNAEETILTNNNNNNHSIMTKSQRFVKYLSNINNEVKVFETHLKSIRKKSKEINKKIYNILMKRRNKTNIEKKNFINKY